MAVDALVYEIRIEDKGSSILDKIKRNFLSLEGIASGIASGMISAFNSVKDAAVDFAQDSMKSFESFENELALVSKTTGLAGDELQEFALEMRELAKPIGSLKAENLLQVAKVAGQLGITGTKNIQDFSVAIGKGAIALDSFGGNTEKLATHMAKAQTVFGLTTDATENMLSVYSTLATSTAANELEISNFNIAMARSAQLMGLSVEESSALGAVFVSGGQQASQAARLFSSAYLNMAQGGKYVEAAAELITGSIDNGSQAIGELEAITGRSASSFASIGEMITTALGTDAVQTMTVLGSQLERSATQTDNLKVATDAAALATQAFGKTGVPIMNILGAAANRSSEDTKSLSFAMDSANEAFQNGQTYLDAYDRQTAKSGEQFKVFGSILNDIQLTVGGPLLQAFGTFYQEYLNPIVSSFAEWLSKSELMSQFFPKVLADISAAAGGLLEYLVEIVKNLDWEGLISKAQELYTQLIEYIKSVDLAEIWNSFKSAAEGAFTFLQQSLPTIIEFIGKLNEWLGNSGSTLSELAPLIEFFADAWKLVSAAIEHVKKVTQPFFDFVVNEIMALVKILEGDLSGGVKDVIDGIITFLKENIDLASDMFGGLADAAIDAFKGIVDWIKGGVLDAFDALKNKITDVIGSILDLGKEAFGQSVLPDIKMWAEKDVESFQQLAAQTSANMAGMQEYGAAAQNAGNQALESLMAQKDQLERNGAAMMQFAALTANAGLLIQDVFKRTELSRGLNRAMFADDTSQAAQPITGESVAMTNPLDAIGRQNPMININFTGNNIVDENSTEAFARLIGQTLAQQGSRVIQ